MAKVPETADQSLKSKLLSPVALAAYVAAAAALAGALAGAYVGYTLGEKQYALELEKWRVKVIIDMGNNSNKDTVFGHATNLIKSKIMSDDNVAMICRIWPVANCPPPPPPPTTPPKK
jgi:hypothetical protein